MARPKITFIGAGSTVFARNLIRDMFLFPELHDAEIALMDIDADRLRVTETVARRIADQAGANATISATTDRRAALRDANYVINMIQVGGYRPSTVIDFEIPKKYGLRQTIGDTLGIGGIFRAARTIPVLYQIANDMEELCPEALFLNYTNPMAILMMALNAFATFPTVGLCHSVQGTAAQLADVLNLPRGEIDYICAGINHMAFYLKLEHRGRDLYPALQHLVATNQQPETERVRYEVLKRFGYFVTESSEHFAEYVPWFIKRDRPDLIEHYRIPLDEYPARCERQIAQWETLEKSLLAGDPDDSGKASYKHSGEYASLIIHSMETGQPRVIYGNVDNNDLIANLPAECCVEVPCLVDRQGIQPTQIGLLPPQLAALMQTNINVQMLTAQAILTQQRDHLYQAAMLDPHTAAELSPDEICSLVDDLIDAHAGWIPEFA